MLILCHLIYLLLVHFLLQGGSRSAHSTSKRLVTGGGDYIVKIWREENDRWELEEKLEAHTDWVRDVAWSPSVGLPVSRIASCSQVREHMSNLQ